MTRRTDPKGRAEGEGPVLCDRAKRRRTGAYMTEVRISSLCERPCAGIEDTRETPVGTGGQRSNCPRSLDGARTGKRLAGKLHKPFERVVPADRPLRFDAEMNTRNTYWIEFGIVVALLAVAPLVLPKFWRRFLTEILIWGLLAMSSDILIGYTGMISFGQSAFSVWACTAQRTGTTSFTTASGRQRALCYQPSPSEHLVRRNAMPARHQYRHPWLESLLDHPNPSPTPSGIVDAEPP
jgi:hypothetical protein